MTKLDKKNMPFVEPFETDCDPCLAPECGHTKRCIKKLQAENKQYRWIPVGERLPELFNVPHPHSTDVLIAGVPDIYIGWLCKDRGWRYGDGTVEIHSTHWMPIPALKKGG